jgi:hypothetical protein
MKVIFLKNIKSKDNECGATLYKGIVYDVSVESSTGTLQPWVTFHQTVDLKNSIEQSIFASVFREYLRDGICKIIKDKN